MKNMLNKLSLPEDLHDLSYRELDQVCTEVRDFIISSVTETGGHLAPSLGAVELSVALHAVFKSPQDKIIWDVGHQAYPHKILTGRKDKFDNTFRKFGGMSGFLKRAESRHDIFDAGHSSTSLSAAMGIAAARDLAGDNFDVVAVIGDGALTGGMAFEALNHIGSTGKKVIVIINDNGMSISKNVGALSNYLSKLRLQPLYYKIRSDIEYLLNKIPAIGSKMIKAIARVKGSLKHILIPGALFEELGFTYFGPVDGHSMQVLIETLEQAKTRPQPCIIHALTIKGKGYRPAEERPHKYHGIASCKSKKSESYTDVFSHEICRIAETDKRVCGITAAMCEGTGLSVFAEKYPDRFFDVGICEPHAVTFGAALALSGLKPYVSVYSTFLQRGYDQIMHDVCLQKLPVNFILDRGGLVGEDGPTHHGVFDFSYLSHMPGMVICAPSDQYELRDMLQMMHQYIKGPVALRYPRGKTLDIPERQPEEIQVGKSAVLKQGSKIALVAVGSMVQRVVAAQEYLKDITPTIVNARFVKPLDIDMLDELEKNHSTVITFEENSVIGGFGSMVSDYYRSKKSSVKVVKIGIEDEFVPHGTLEELDDYCGFTPEKLADRIREA